MPSLARAVVVYQNPNRNLRAPAGSLANSGWQWEGQWGGFLGTAISKKYFITASHFGGDVNQTYTFLGVGHRTTDYWDDPNSDLRIYKVAGTLPIWAPLYTGSTEANQAAMIFGRGTQRGEGLFVNGKAKGWKWGAEDGRQSWGRNAINGVVDGGSGTGKLLQMTFDEHGMAYESTITRGDSGGGVFIKNGSNWQLAGVNYSTDGVVTLTKGGSGIEASLFDRGGLYDSGGNFVTDTTANIPSNAYASRISSNQSWINQVLSGMLAPTIGSQTQSFAGDGNSPTPEPSGIVTLAGVLLLAARRTPRDRLAGQ